MKRVKISELKNNLSRLLAYVRRGGTVRVFDRDRPVADIVPCKPAATAGGDDALLAELEREGIVRRGSGVLPEDFPTRKLPVAGASVVAALLEERSETR